MKIHVISFILFFFVFCTSTINAQQLNGTSTTEEKSTQGTVLRTSNPNYVEQVTIGGKVSSERMKNPNVEEIPSTQKRESEAIITNEKS